MRVCEARGARACIASYVGAADPSGSSDLPEWSSFTSPTDSSSLKHSLAEINSLIGKIEMFQADGFVAKVTEKFKFASFALKEAILFCVDSGASDHICSKMEAFETLDKNAPSKLFKVVHGTARIRSEGVGTVLLPVTLPDGKVVRIRLYNVYYIPSQPFNLISVPRCIDQGWDDPKFSKLSWNYKGINVPLARHGNYFVKTAPVQQSSIFGAFDESSSGVDVDVKADFSQAQGPVKPVKQSQLEAKKSHADAKYQRSLANRPFREKADWQFSKTEYAKWANELGDSSGRFHCDLFTDGKGPVAGNAQEPKFYSRQDDAFKHY